MCCFEARLVRISKDFLSEIESHFTVGGVFEKREKIEVMKVSRVFFSPSHNNL